MNARHRTQLVKRPKSFDSSSWESHQVPPFCNGGDHVADVPAILRRPFGSVDHSG